MDGFAFVLHPLDAKRDVARRYPLAAQLLPTALIHFLARRWPPLLLSHIDQVRSLQQGMKTQGWLLACPLSAGQMLNLPPQAVYDKVVQAGRLGQRHGAGILGLGAFTSVVGDGGVTVAQRLNMPVTTGKSLTVASALEALGRGAENRGLALETATVAVVGGSGSIGLACAEMLAPMVGRLVLVGRREIRLSQARAQAEAAGAADVRVSTELADVATADVVLSATSSSRPVLTARHLKKNVIVCDVALPRDVDPSVSRDRSDVLVIDGGMVGLPGMLDLGFELGLPAGRISACMAEVIILALEGRYESFSLGQRVQTEKVREITQLARKHGFRLSAGGVFIEAGNG